MMGDTYRVCQPCRDGTHMECDNSKEKPCGCLVCEGERIGDRIVGELDGNMPRHGPIHDRFDPRPWRP
jgi:hypothetical protein